MASALEVIKDKLAVALRLGETRRRNLSDAAHSDEAGSKNKGGTGEATADSELLLDADGIAQACVRIVGEFLDGHEVPSAILRTKDVQGSSAQEETSLPLQPFEQSSSSDLNTTVHRHTKPATEDRGKLVLVDPAKVVVEEEEEEECPTRLAFLHLNGDPSGMADHDFDPQGEYDSSPGEEEVGGVGSLSEFSLWRAGSATSSSPCATKQAPAAEEKSSKSSVSYKLAMDIMVGYKYKEEHDLSPFGREAGGRALPLTAEGNVPVFTGGVYIFRGDGAMPRSRNGTPYLNSSTCPSGIMVSEPEEPSFLCLTLTAEENKALNLDPHPVSLPGLGFELLDLDLAFERPPGNTNATWSFENVEKNQDGCHNSGLGVSRLCGLSAPPGLPSKTASRLSELRTPPGLPSRTISRLAGLRPPPGLSSIDVTDVDVKVTSSSTTVGGSEIGGGRGGPDAWRIVGGAEGLNREKDATLTIVGESSTPFVGAKANADPATTDFSVSLKLGDDSPESYDWARAVGRGIQDSCVGLKLEQAAGNGARSVLPRMDSIGVSAHLKENISKSDAFSSTIGNQAESSVSLPFSLSNPWDNHRVGGQASKHGWNHYNADSKLRWEGGGGIFKSNAFYTKGIRKFSEPGKEGPRPTTQSGGWERVRKSKEACYARESGGGNRPFYTEGAPKRTGMEGHGTISNANGKYTSGGARVCNSGGGRDGGSGYTRENEGISSGGFSGGGEVQQPDKLPEHGTGERRVKFALGDFEPGDREGKGYGRGPGGLKTSFASQRSGVRLMTGDLEGSAIAFPELRGSAGSSATALSGSSFLPLGVRGESDLLQGDDACIKPSPDMDLQEGSIPRLVAHSSGSAQRAGTEAADNKDTPEAFDIPVVSEAEAVVTTSPVGVGLVGEVKALPGPSSPVGAVLCERETDWGVSFRGLADQGNDSVVSESMQSACYSIGSGTGSTDAGAERVDNSDTPEASETPLVSEAKGVVNTSPPGARLMGAARDSQAALSTPGVVLREREMDWRLSLHGLVEQNDGNVVVPEPMQRAGSSIGGGVDSAEVGTETVGSSGILEELETSFSSEAEIVDEAVDDVVVTNAPAAVELVGEATASPGAPSIQGAVLCECAMDYEQSLHELMEQDKDNAVLPESMHSAGPSIGGEKGSTEAGSQAVDNIGGWEALETSFVSEAGTVDAAVNEAVVTKHSTGVGLVGTARASPGAPSIQPAVLCEREMDLGLSLSRLVEQDDDVTESMKSTGTSIGRAKGTAEAGAGAIDNIYWPEALETTFVSEDETVDEAVDEAAVTNHPASVGCTGAARASPGAPCIQGALKCDFDMDWGLSLHGLVKQDDDVFVTESMKSAGPSIGGGMGLTEAGAETVDNIDPSQALETPFVSEAETVDEAVDDAVDEAVVTNHVGRMGAARASPSTPSSQGAVLCKRELDWELSLHELVKQDDNVFVTESMKSAGPSVGGGMDLTEAGADTVDNIDPPQALETPFVSEPETVGEAVVTMTTSPSGVGLVGAVRASPGAPSIQSAVQCEPEMDWGLSLHGLIEQDDNAVVLESMLSAGPFNGGGMVSTEAGAENFNNIGTPEELERPFVFEAEGVVTNSLVGVGIVEAASVSQGAPSTQGVALREREMNVGLSLNGLVEQDANAVVLGSIQSAGSSIGGGMGSMEAGAETADNVGTIEALEASLVSEAEAVDKAVVTYSPAGAGLVGAARASPGEPSTLEAALYGRDADWGLPLHGLVEQDDDVVVPESMQSTGPSGGDGMGSTEAGADRVDDIYTLEALETPSFSAAEVMVTNPPAGAGLLGEARASPGAPPTQRPVIYDYETDGGLYLHGSVKQDDVMVVPDSMHNPGPSIGSGMGSTEAEAETFDSIDTPEVFETPLASEAQAVDEAVVAYSSADFGHTGAARASAGAPSTHEAVLCACETDWGLSLHRLFGQDEDVVSRDSMQSTGLVIGDVVGSFQNAQAARGSDDFSWGDSLRSLFYDREDIGETGAVILTGRAEGATGRPAMPTQRLQRSEELGGGSHVRVMFNDTDEAAAPNLRDNAGAVRGDADVLESEGSPNRESSAPVGGGSVVAASSRVSVPSAAARGTGVSATDGSATDDIATDRAAATNEPIALTPSAPTKSWLGCGLPRPPTRLLQWATATLAQWAPSGPFALSGMRTEEEREVYVAPGDKRVGAGWRDRPGVIPCRRDVSSGEEWGVRGAQGPSHCACL